jgi:hypothetical protein
LPDPAGVVEFLKRRYARAIECGDDRTATRLRAEIDRLINGPPALLSFADRVGAAGSRRSAGAAQLQPTYDHNDILYGYDDILGPNL